MVPVNSADRILLGMKWDGMVYVDKSLPFGLQSVPLVLLALADTLAWIMIQRGLSLVDHYIDDFIILGRASSKKCKRNQRLMLETCETMGVPIKAKKKSEEPCSTLVFLSIERDTIAMEMRLPPDKLSKLKESLAAWRGKKASRKCKMLSLIGSLSHASKVVKPSRSFLRRFIELSKQTKELGHFIRLNKEARSDIKWWYQFAGTWNEISLINQVAGQRWDVEITSDASRGWS